MKTEDEANFEMPTPCIKCNEIFELEDGIVSPRKYPNTIICFTCAEKEQKIMELEIEIQDAETTISDAKITIQDYTEQLIDLKLELEKLNNS